MRSYSLFLFFLAVLVLILYVRRSAIHKRWKEDVRKSSIQLKPEPPQMQPVEADLPLSAEDAAVACGKVLKLNQAAFAKLDLIARLSRLVRDSGFTDVELKELTSEKDLEEQAFQAYAMAYVTWDQPAQVSRASLDKMVIDVASSQDESSLSPEQRAQVAAYLSKLKQMMLKAFDLGRHDARISPCPY